MAVILVIIALVILMVAPHEWGHYISARIFGVRAREFSLGMGTKLISYKKGRGVRWFWQDLKEHKKLKVQKQLKKCGLEEQYIREHEADRGKKNFKRDMAVWVDEQLVKEELADFDGHTEWSLRLFPLGGFVRLDEDSEHSEYASLKKWQKCIVLASGAFMNFVTAFVMIVLIAVIFRPLTPTMIVSDVGETMVDSGIQVEDEILTVNGKSYPSPADIIYGVGLGDTNIVDIEVKRGDEVVMLEDVELAIHEEQGVKLNLFDCKFYGKEMTFTNGLKYTFNTMYTGMYSTVLSLKELVTGDIGVSSMTSIIGAGDMIQKQAEVDLYSAFYLIAFILLNVGIFNLLPIPALDGGHIAVNIIEGVTGKKIKMEVLNMISMIFFSLIMLLSLWLMGKDVLMVFFK